jgi:hypothetical protein
LLEQYRKLSEEKNKKNIKKKKLDNILSAAQYKMIQQNENKELQMGSYTIKAEENNGS